MTDRLALLLGHENPVFENFDPNGAAITRRYADQDPTVVLERLKEALVHAATQFEAVSPRDAIRRGRRADGTPFTVDSLGRYLLHEVVHHTHDVGA
jgi:hypothetical protein